MAGASGRPRSGVLCCVARYLQRYHVVAEGESRWLSCKNVPIVHAACTLGAAPPLHSMKSSHLTPITSPFSALEAAVCFRAPPGQSCCCGAACPAEVLVPYLAADRC